jgi:hypothetical protein
MSQSITYKVGIVADVIGRTLGGLDDVSSLHGRFWFQKLSWGPAVRFPMLSTSQTFLGFEPESSCLGCPSSASSS